MHLEKVVQTAKGSKHTIIYMHNFQANYDKIIKILKELDCNMEYLNQIGKPKLNDKQLIAVDLASDYMCY